MKRWFWTLAAALAVTAALTLGASAAEITDSGECGAQGDNLTWTLDSEGTLTISGTGEMADYKYSGAAPWCGGHDDPVIEIKEVTIKDGVTSIGNFAWDGSDYDARRRYSFTTVTIPESVTSIGERAFAICDLTGVIIPSSVTSIGMGAFEWNLTPKTAGPIGSGCDYEFGWTESIPAYAFSDSYLTSVTIPESVTSIGKAAFANTGLASVTIPEGVTSIETETFCLCGMIDVTIPESVTSIGDRAFGGCRDLTSLTVPESVTSIGADAFEDCTGLTDIYYGGSRKAWRDAGGPAELNDGKTKIHYGTRFTVTATAGEHGSIDPSGAVSVYEGDSEGFTVVPDEGYRTTLTLDGVTVMKNGVLVEGTLPDVSEVIAAGGRADTDSVSYYAYPGEPAAGRVVRLYLIDVCADREVSAVFTAEEDPAPSASEETGKKLDELAGDLTATGEDIRRALEGMSGDIAGAVKELGGEIFDKIEALEKRLGEGGSATVEVEAGAGFVKTDISVTGAKLNFDYSKTVSLKIGKPEDPDIRVPEAPAGQALTRFSMKLVEGGNNNVAELTVPIRVTLPVPARSLKGQTLKIWHFHGGRLVPVTLTSRPFQRDGQWYVSFMVSGFSDFIMSYEEDAPVTAALSPDGRRVELTDPAGALAGGARVLAARYEDGALADLDAAGLAAGETAAAFTKRLGPGWRLFLLDPGTGAPLCAPVDLTD